MTTNLFFRHCLFTFRTTTNSNIILCVWTLSGPTIFIIHSLMHSSVKVHEMIHVVKTYTRSITGCSITAIYGGIGDCARELTNISAGCLLYEMVYSLADLKRMCCEARFNTRPICPAISICKRPTILFSQILINARFIVFTMLGRMYMIRRERISSVQHHARSAAVLLF